MSEKNRPLWQKKMPTNAEETPQKLPFWLGQAKAGQPQPLGRLPWLTPRTPTK